jgi:hypothetical protein
MLWDQVDARHDNRHERAPKGCFEGERKQAKATMASRGQRALLLICVLAVSFPLFLALANPTSTTRGATSHHTTLPNQS